MLFLIGLLTLVMVLDCAFLIFLVLIQLPKKEAGAGLAFGAGTTDTLFGSGTGNVLTQATKYAAIVFFVLAFSLSILQSKYHHRSQSEFEQELRAPSRLPVAEAPAATPAPAATTPAAPAAKPAMALTTSTNLLSAPAATNAPAAK
jgi:preprotein translocase subunit SecG